MLHPLRRGAVLLALLLTAVLSACGSSGLTPVSQSTLFAYNNLTDLLAGDLWDVTLPTYVAGDLAGVPASWAVIGLGTTDTVGRNGEIIVDGVGPTPRTLWADPQSPQSVTPAASTNRYPFLAVAACNPAGRIVVDATAGDSIATDVATACAGRGITVAAVRVTGTFTDVSYAIAYNLLKSGTPLTSASDLSLYEVLETASTQASWFFDGFYAEDSTDQALLTIGGAAVYLHGARADLGIGGELTDATVVSATIEIYPLSKEVTHKPDLTVDSLVVNGDLLSFEVHNLGTMEVTQVPVTADSGTTAIWTTTGGPLGAGRSVRLQDLLTTSVDPTTVKVTVDPNHQIIEPNDTHTSTGAGVTTTSRRRGSAAAGRR